MDAIIYNDYIALIRTEGKYLYIPVYKTNSQLSKKRKISEEGQGATGKNSKAKEKDKDDNNYVYNNISKNRKIIKQICKKAMKKFD